MSGNADKQSMRRIPTLDGWRGVAVALVFAAHCSDMLGRNGSSIALHLKSLVEHAGYGVDIFFVLSGFIICTLLIREKEKTGTINLSTFYIKRAFRILPAIAVYLAVIEGLCYVRILPKIPLSEFVSVLFFYRNYTIASWYTGHFWSLAVEEHFYALAPILILIASRKAAIRGAFVLIAFCIFIREYEFSHGLFTNTLVQFRTENRFDGLLWGCLLAFALNDAAVKAFLQKNLRFGVFAGVIVVAICSLTLFTSQPARRGIVAFLLPPLIAYTVLRPDSIIGRVLESSPLRWLGKISYSLYIWQILFLIEATRPLGAFNLFPLAMIAPVLCALLSYHLVEKPMVALGHRVVKCRLA